MTVKAALVVDDAVGERRRVLLDSDGRPFRLEIERWSEQQARARLDEVWWGRATARLPGGAGWFVDLGGETGVIEATKSAAIVEGGLISVRIKSEAWSNKGPSLSLFNLTAATPRPDRPERHAPAPEDVFLSGVEIVDQHDGADARREIDAAIGEALHPVVSIPGGGDIAIEHTRALTTVDVDAADRTGPGANYVRDLNLAAGAEAARQISLRGIAGLVVVDFLTMASRKDRETVAAHLRDALGLRLGRASDVGEITRFGLCEASIARRQRPISDALGTGAEREALDAIRMIETEGQSARGARIHARVSPEAARWLETDVIGWKKALADRIGARWHVEVASGPHEAPDVWSAR